MENFYKYIPTRELNSPFKLIVQNGGCYKSEPGMKYPDINHPDHHYFDYSKGRRLDEYQLLYILHGKGIIETKNCKQRNLNEGDLVILFPGEWHRYKPDKSIGWTEYWVGFTGNFDEFFNKNDLINYYDPIIETGNNEQILTLYNQIINLLKSNSPGDLLLLSGVTSNLLSFALAIKQRKVLEYSESINEIIKKAKLIIEENWKTDLSPKSISNELNVSYSWLRKYFKQYSDISIKEYQLNLKLNKARELLMFSDLSIKEIAFETGFNSQYHFSKIFKMKKGISPIGFRKKGK